MDIALFILLPLLTLAGLWSMERSARRAGPETAGARRAGWARALGLALVLFWLCRTAGERRIGLGLSLFALSTPARLAALCACLLLAFALLRHPAGRRLEKRLAGAFSGDGALFLLSLGGTVLFVLWGLRITVLSYMTNDDAAIIAAIVRTAEEGLSAASASFSHVLFCGMLAWLYRLAPNVLWYLGYHLLALTLSLALIGWCVLRACRARGWTAGGGLLLLLCLYGTFLYAYAQMSFTVTPAVVGSAAVALVLTRDPGRAPAGRIALDALGAALMLLCYLQRPDTGRCLLCFWGLACGYALARLLMGGAGRVRRTAALGAYVLAVLALVGAARIVGRSGAYSRSEEYADAEYYRSLIVDFLVDDLTLEDYADAGIPEELAVLVHGWFFMDERITTDTFRALAEAHYENSGASEAAISSYPAQMLSEIFGEKQMAYRALSLAALLLIAAGGLLRRGKKTLPEVLTALFACGGAVILWLYLVYQGRFPVRVFLVVLYPALVTVLLTSLLAGAPPEERSPGRTRAALLLTGAGLAAFAVLCAMSLAAVPHAEESVGRDEVFAEEMTVESYVRAHPDTTFVTNIYIMNRDPLHLPDYPANKVLWGAVGDTYRSDRLYADAFFREDVRFLCKTRGYILFLMQYLETEYGPVEALQTDELTDRIVVYDVDAVTPGADYTGWYEHDGQTYWFEDGEAAAGTRVIDGTTYVFAPPGAASSLIIHEADGTALFTTDAYSRVAA